MKRRILQLKVFTTNTFLEALRNKTIYAVLVAAGLTMGAALTMGSLSLGHDERVFHNLVFFTGMLFLIALAIYQGVTALHREIESDTIFTVLSKPVTRGSFLVGKYTASVAILTVCAIAMFGLKLLAALLLGHDVTSTHFAAYLTGILQLAIVVAVAFFFASFSTPLLSALFTFSVVLIGNLTPQIQDASREFSAEGNPIHFGLDAALYIVPDLEKLNLSYELTYGMSVPTSYFLHAFIYTGVVILFLLLFSHLIFSRRDFA